MVALDDSRWFHLRWREGGASIKGNKQTLGALTTDAYGAELGNDKKGVARNLVATNLLMWLETYEKGRGHACKIKVEKHQKKVVIGVPPQEASVN